MLSVGGESDSVGTIWGSSLHLGDKILIPEELTNVRDSTASYSSLAQDCNVQAGDNVVMDRTSRVVTGEESIERHYAITISWLDATQEGSVDVGGIGSVAITL